MGSTCVVQPVDLVKTRMQLTAGAGAKESAFSIAAKVLRSEGIIAMYNGYVIDSFNYVSADIAHSFD